MECDKARVFISRDLDGELPDEARARLEEHVAQCADCASYGRQCRSLQRLIDRSALPSQVPDVRRGARPEEVPPARRQALGAGAALYRLAALVLAVASVAFLWLWVGERSAATGLRTELARHAAGQAAGAADAWEGDAVPASPGLDAAPPTEYVRAVRALGDYFRGELKWVALDGPQMELGVSGYAGAVRAAAARQPAAVLSVRVVAVGPGKETRLVSSPTVLLRPGAEANFRLAETQGAPNKGLAYRCAYDATDGPGGLVSVGLTIQGGPAGRPVHLWGAVRPDDDGATPAAYARVGSVRYVLFLSARPLPERDAPNGQA